VDLSLKSDFSYLSELCSVDVDEDDLWEVCLSGQLYISPIIWESNPEWKDFVLELKESDPDSDPLWEQVKLEALAALGPEPEAGPQLYQGILSQPSLVEAIVTIIAHEIETELIKATELRNLFLQMLTEEDEEFIRSDVIAAATRSPSIGSAFTAVLFHVGLHALVCYRVGHRLWQADRKGLAFYLQSTVSRRYSADIHPACRMGSGAYLCCSAGVVIGETAVTGNDVSILHGVTLGGSGKERGDRHPKVGNGVIFQDGATVLGNISVGDGSLITAKSIVTKPVPPLAIMSGVPAKVIKYRSLDIEDFRDDLDQHLAFKYLDEWKDLLPKEEEAAADTYRK
jgi:serine O-acetyltransferase